MNQWRLLDDLGRTITEILKEVEQLQAPHVRQFVLIRNIQGRLLVAKDLVHQLKSDKVKGVVDEKVTSDNQRKEAGV